MADFDASNPNIDGDFVALLEVRKKRAAVDAKRKQSTLTVSHVKVDDDLITFQKEEKEKESDFESLRSSLFAAVDKDDVAECDRLCRQIIEKYKDTGEEHPFESHVASAVEHALENKKQNVSKYFIENGSVELITEEFDVMVGSIPSKKTCLHILTEQGDIELAKMLLGRLSGDRKESFLGKTVLMKVEGQRPRHLSAIHIAALEGNTDFVEMLLSLGVSANTTNTKNDTPVLWAARFNHIDTVRSLIKHGANLNHRNDKGSTPLYWAVRYGLPEMVEVLLKEGKADVHQKRDLGLVSTIVMASALGYENIVKLLLDHGADVHTRITGGRTALHLAASEGHTEVVEFLLHNNANIEEEDDVGLTALLHAIQGGHLDTINTLLSSGANISIKTNLGHTIWDYALKNDDTDLIENIITLYKNMKRLKAKTLLLPPGRSPLHVCVLSPDASVEKVKLLISLGIDKSCVDLNGNTFYHIAAREGKSEILEAFLNEVDLNQQNSDGDTALHHAASTGSIDSLNILLKKAKLDIGNNSGETPLHIAARSHMASAEAVEKVVDVVVKAHNWKLIDQADNRGNTALHLAARAGRVEVIPQLTPLNPTLLNKNGESPMHIAAHSDVPDLLETMLDVFNTPEKGLDLNQPKADGETLLHITAKRGDADAVQMIIRLGADVSVCDASGNTVLHDLAEKSMENTIHIEEILLVFHVVINNAVWWWCARNDLPYPDQDSEMYNKHLQKAVLYLTQNITNNGGLTVLNYATALGATDVLQALFSVDNVYRFNENRNYLYDVTNLLPDTKSKSKRIKRKSKTSIGVMKDDNNNKDKEKIKNFESSRSCLEIIVDMENTILATQLLDVHPLNELVKDIWSAYQWIYVILMAIHITYMGLFSAYAVPYTTLSIHGNTTSRIQDYEPLLGLFIAWPGFILFCQIYNFCFVIAKYCRIYQEHTKSDDRKGEKGKASWKVGRYIGLALSWVFDNMVVWGGILFSVFVIAWFGLYANHNFDQIYLLVVALITGWLYGISFTKGFYSVHAFSIMLKHIISRDIVRFVVIYFFVLMAFGFGMHALFQISPPVAANYPTTLHSLFTTFNLMIGMDEIFNESTDEDFSSYNSSSWYLRTVYVVYIFMSTIILFNLLIAMMTDTYNHIQSREGTTWRVSSIRMALNIEGMLPFVPQVLKKGLKILRTNMRYDDEKQRWMMIVPKNDVQQVNVLQDEQMRALQKLEGKFTLMSNAMNELSQKLEEMGDRTNEMGSMLASISVGNARPSLSPRKPSALGKRMSVLREMPLKRK